MPSDEYSSFGKGALKLKGGGGKVKKHKKKKDKGSSDLEKALSTGETSAEHQDGDAVEKQDIKRSKSKSPVPEEEVNEAPVVRQKTEAERRFEEAKRKKVSAFTDLRRDHVC